MSATPIYPRTNNYDQFIYQTNRFNHPEQEANRLDSPEQEEASAPPMETQAPGVEDFTFLEDRVNQIRNDFFPSANSTNETSRTTSRSSSGGSSFNSTLINLSSNNTTVTNNNSRGSREKENDKMSGAAQIAIFVIGAGVLLGSMAKLGTWVRQINEARESKSMISNYQSDIAQNIKRMDKRIIRSCSQKLGFGVSAVAFSIVGIAGAALGSYALVWTAAIGTVLTVGVFVFQWQTGELDTAKRIQQFYNPVQHLAA